MRLLPSFLFCCGLLLGGGLSAQTLVIGQVTDTDGEPLLGVTVLELGTTNGTITDLDGNFELEVTGQEARLRFSYVGMKEVIRRLSPDNRVRTSAGREAIGLRVRMEELANELQEVVVTAYRGELERKDLVGSYQGVQMEELLPDRPIESIDKLLEGQVAGVRIISNTGEPGLPVQVQIRGQGSLPAIGSRISASTQPLFVLDGVPLFDVTEQNTTNSVFSDINSQRLNPLSFLNPEDIESITVLKDASATALYGADAANGVILITTKSGGGQGDRINVSYNQGFANTINEVQFLNTEQYVELARETLFNSGRDPAEAGTTDVSTDWRELVQRTSVNRDLDISLSGGQSKGVRYRLGAGYNQLESIHVGNGLEQLNLSLKVDVPIGRRFDFSTRINSGYQKREGINTFDVFTFPPNLPIRLADGSFNNDGFFERRPNPIAALEQNENETTSWNWNAQSTFNYRPVEALSLRLLGGLDRQESQQFQYDSALNGSGQTQGGRLSLGNRQNTQWVANVQASWSPEFANTNHHFSTLLGGELNGQLNQNLVATGSNFPFDDLRQLRFLPREDKNISESEFVRRKASLYGELAYNYDYRYYLKLNGRRDASSIFGGDQQAQLLWAIGASWNLSEEDWWGEQLLGIGYAKLRTSYGITGNSRIGVYSAAGLYRFTSNSLYGGQVPLTASSPINEFLGWERKRKLNVALDLNFGKQQAWSLTAEYYRNTTIDAITSVNIPYENGFNTLIANAAELQNQGLELSVGYRTPTDRRWHYNTSFNFARNRNVLLDIDNEQLPSLAGDPRAFRIGEDVSTIYAVRWAGIDPATGLESWFLPNGEITTIDDEAQGVENLVPVGNGSPDLQGGWRHSLRVGALSFNLLLNYSFGAEDLVNPLTFTDGRQILFNNQSINQLDRWRQPGDITDTPRLNLENQLLGRSTRYLYTISYIQLASAGLTYSFPEDRKLPFGARELRCNLLVNNLGYHYFGDDTPANRNGVAEYRFTFPEQRAIVFGIRVGW
jgi:TonB-linked SusC/RagA family outer membrane protein